MTDAHDAIARYRKNLQDEIDSAALYRGLAEAERSPKLREVFLRLAAMEEEHARFWEQKLRELGVPVPQLRPGWRTRVLIALARHLGAALVLPTVTAREWADQATYDAQPEAAVTALPATEHQHARLLQLIGRERPSGLPGSALAILEGRHRAVGGNALRAAVLGANDGLVSNLSLVMGVAGADLAPKAILLTGIAGLLAGSLSMAMGEWLSVQSARELFEHQIRIEREELIAFPEEEREELELIYRAKGVPADTARELADRLIREGAPALGTLVREELAIDPEELGGSAWEAAIASFLLFSIGAIVPVLPYIAWGGIPAAVASVVLSGLALFLLGAGITAITGRSALRSGLRQVLIGLAAAAITFGVGRLFGVALAG
ncbi:MAG: VIT1/CCC1 transporter family protein [Thermomicrobium sp.]|uniref:VIT1/CCC1 family protein n=2 Tax=Thermomicrobium sp. TaxID=1969469 RepID=UPI001B2AA3B9|nr:VIT1/CCC1 family protein [Thermomicrobium sp.]MBO9350254.1 VIT1/CCC1 transporter family protein [Thermomicrobium sp.]